MQKVDEIKQKLKGPVAVLLGGTSSEREISLNSGAAVLAALQHSGVNTEAVDTAGRDWIARVQQFAHVFIALHGPGGEDGTVQGTLQSLGLPYTGSGVMASALAMDKLRCKQMWRGMGLPTPDFVRLEADSDWQAVIGRLGQAIVKPACEGSSIGMSRAANAEELARAYALAAPYGQVFAEQWISGEEYTVAILGREALPPIRLETDNAFYDFDAKYVSNATRYICPCGLAASDEQALRQLAIDAFDSLACKGWGRVDVMRDQGGRFYLLEVNTVPGMTDHSLVPMAAREHGLDFDQLVLRILAESLEGDR